MPPKDSVRAVFRWFFMGKSREIRRRFRKTVRKGRLSPEFFVTFRPGLS